MSRRSGNYPKELRERAVRMVAEIRPDHSSEWAAMESVASKLVSAPRRLFITGSGRRRWMRDSGRELPARNQRSCGS